MKPADKMTKKEVIDFLVKCGIWVKDSKIAKADLDRAKVALENMKDEMANIEHGQNPEDVEKFAEPQDAVATSVIMTKNTPQGEIALIDGDHEWRIRLPDGTLKGMATKHLNIDQAKKYFSEMPVEKMYTTSEVATAAKDIPSLLKGILDCVQEADTHLTKAVHAAQDYNNFLEKNEIQDLSGKDLELANKIIKHCEASKELAAKVLKIV